MRTAIFAAAICALLSGCGQKGPLFMPNESPDGTSLNSRSNSLSASAFSFGEIVAAASISATNTLSLNRSVRVASADALAPCAICQYHIEMHRS